MKDNNTFNHLNDDKLLLKLSGKILEASGQPKDYFEVAAVLEAMGYSDQRVKNEFGYANVFEISHDLFNYLIENKQYNFNNSKRSFDNSNYKLRNVISDIIRGMLSICPLLILMFSVFLINFSLWSFMDKSISSIERATSIAFATILSMIVSGGFTQAFLRKGYMFLEQNCYKSIWKEYIQYFKLGLITALAIAAVISILNIFTGIYKWENIIIFDLYFIFLTMIWISVSVTSLIKGEFIFVFNLIISTGLVYYFKEFAGLNIVFSQVLAMIFFIIINIVVLKTIFYFQMVTKKGKDSGNDYKPKLLMSLYLLAPYFSYGLLYYSLIFMDRLLAWTANAGIILEPVMRMKGDYDLGMNWAILTILIPAVFVEVFVKLFINDVMKAKKKFNIIRQTEFQRKSIKRFLIYTVVFFILCVLGALASVGIINTVVNYYNIELSPYYSQLSTLVFVTSIIGYIFLIAGMLNNIYLSYFSQGRMIVKLLLVSLGTNFIVGFLLSRICGYYFAVFGFLAGAIIFFILSQRYAYKILKSLDYYFYTNS